MIKKPQQKRRRRKALSAAPSRRRTRRKSGGLADMFNPTVAMQSAKNTAAAAGGGLLSMIVNKSILPPTAGKVAKVGTALIGGFVMSAFGMNNVGSGFAGGLMALTFQNGLLAEDDFQEEDFADDMVLSEQPIFLDDDGNPMFLNENEGAPFMQYLNEDEIAEYEGAATYGTY